MDDVDAEDTLFDLCLFCVRDAGLAEPAGSVTCDNT